MGALEKMIVPFCKDGVILIVDDGLSQIKSYLPRVFEEFTSKKNASIIFVSQSIFVDDKNFIRMSQNHIQSRTPSRTLEQLPNEILEKICEYLTFEERCKFGATNRRNQFVLTADKFWHNISIPNHLLKYELINKLVNMGTRSLSIPWSSIDGEWAEYSPLVSTLSPFTSQLAYL